MKSAIAAAALSVALSASAATPSGIFPNPQSETVGSTAFSSETTYRLTGADAADADAVGALRRALSVSESGAVEIIIGEHDDAAVSSVASLIPSQVQGYYLKVEPGKVIIAGRDAEGTYYGVQSFLQLAAKAEVPSVEVKDWPLTAVRGVIEGYYGNPWSHEDCMDMCTFFDQNKMNTFIYGPKNDSYHHGSGVFTPYPDAEAAALAALVKEADAHKVDIVWAMHPGNSNDGANLARAKTKFEAMYDLGFRRFAVFFDDIAANSVQKQIDFLNYINKEVVKAKGDVKGLIVCPSEYCISFAGGWNTSSTYLNSLGAGLDEDIDIMWTGSQVVDMELANSCTWFTNKTGRNPFIWHNYPCSDYGSRPLLLCPYEPAASDLCTRITGFTANPMEYYEASKVGLYGMADFAWNPSAYDPWEAWEEAIDYIMPDHADAFRNYCYTNFNYPAPKTHGGPIIYDETPEFKELLSAKPFSAATAADYAAYFEKHLSGAMELQSLQGNRLVSELAEWLQGYELQNRRGLKLTELQADLAAGNAEKFLADYTAYKEYTATAEALRSRDYTGSLRVLTPFCGSKYVEPFISSTIESLIEAFKATGAEYPEGLFPARLLQSGSYYILYNGKYLTNKSGSTAPSFVAEEDNVNPNRQVWTLRYVPETGRYSLISAEDNRYVNELGNFGTNPYSDDWNTYSLQPLGGLWAIQNGGSSGTGYWSVSSGRVQKGSASEWNTSSFLFQIVAAGDPIPAAPQSAWTDDTYVIKDSRGYYLTRSSNSLAFKKPSTTGAKVKSTQKWTMAVDAESKRVKITQGSYYVNEKPVIGTNQYYSSWNSYKLFNLNGLWAIQNAGDAGSDFWYITDAAGLGVRASSLVNELNFTIVPLEEEMESSIDEISAPDSLPDAAYDLQGRRVANPTRGLYIINGQKVLLK